MFLLQPQYNGDEWQALSGAHNTEKVRFKNASGSLSVSQLLWVDPKTNILLKVKTTKSEIFKVAWREMFVVQHLW